MREETPKSDASLFLLFILIWTVEGVKDKIYNKSSVPWFWVFSPLWIPFVCVVGVAFVKAVREVWKKRKGHPVDAE